MSLSRGLQISLAHSKFCIRICFTRLEPRVRSYLFKIIQEGSADDQAARTILLRITALTAYSARLRMDENTPLCREARDQLDLLIALVERRA